MTTPKRLTIDRKRWARGGKNGEAKMLNKDGCMCCLGFLAVACGVDELSMIDRTGPSGLDQVGMLPPFLFDGRANSRWTNDAMDMNDDTSGRYGITGDRRRQAVLTRHFAAVGIELEFVG